MRITIALLWLAPASVFAGAHITLVPSPPANGLAYQPGEVVNVAIRAQLTAGTPSVPGPGGTTSVIRVRYIQFDFADTDPALGLFPVIHHPGADIGPIPFWDLSGSTTCVSDEASCGTNYFIDGLLTGDNLATLHYTGLTSSGSFMVTLNQAFPKMVAELDVIMPHIQGRFNLDVLNVDESSSNRGAEIRWGFGSTADPTDPSSPLRANSGGITGGQYSFDISECSSNEECVDSNPCTDDLCIDFFCQNPHNSAACSDGLPCTANDYCESGSCVSGGTVDCSDFDGPCYSASCDPTGPDGNCDIATQVANGVSCSDDLFCNGDEFCFDGSCITGEPPCHDGLGCYEIDNSCSPCSGPDDCYDRFACTLKSCVTGVCNFDSSSCEGICCFSEFQCFDGMTFEECNSFSGGLYLGHDLGCDGDPDNDGQIGCSDECPFDSYKAFAGFCGCGIAEVDTDDDGIPDCIDCCEDTTPGTPVDVDGCPMIGGCRAQNGSACLDGVNEQFCVSVSGIYLGNGTTCASPCLDCRGPGILQEAVEEFDQTRFVSFDLLAIPCESALRMTLVSLHHVAPPYSGGPTVPFTSLEGQIRWVGPPAQYIESASAGGVFLAASLQCTPHYQDWSTVGLLHVTGSAIVPSSIYDVESVSASCLGNEAGCEAVSAPLTITTSRWGDVESPFNPPSATVQPDVADISALVNKFRSAPGSPNKARALLAGAAGNPFGEITPEVLGVDLSFSHISACVDAFRGVPYPYAISTCP